MEFESRPPCFFALHQARPDYIVVRLVLAMSCLLTPHDTTYIQMALNLRFILEAVIVEVKIAVKYQKPHSCIYIQLSLETVLIMFCWNYIYIDLCTVQLAYGRVKNCLGDSSSMTLATQSFMISLPRVIHSTHSKGTAIMMPFHLMKARFEHQGEQGPRAPCWS